MTLLDLMYGCFFEMLSCAIRCVRSLKLLPYLILTKALVVTFVPVL